nr:hypothetical protein CFP56_19224 [Quercus suber]
MWDTSNGYIGDLLRRVSDYVGSMWFPAHPGGMVPYYGSFVDDHWAKKNHQVGRQELRWTCAIAGKPTCEDGAVARAASKLARVACDAERSAWELLGRERTNLAVPSPLLC